MALCVWRRAQQFVHAMRRGVEAAREALGVGVRIGEDAAQRFVALCERPGGAEGERRFVLAPFAVLAEHGFGARALGAAALDAVCPPAERAVFAEDEGLRASGCSG